MNVICTIVLVRLISVSLVISFIFCFCDRFVFLDFCDLFILFATGFMKLFLCEKNKQNIS